MRRPARRVSPVPVSSTATSRWSAAGSTTTETVPPSGVCRTAFASRLSRTRSTLSGAMRTGTTAATSAPRGGCCASRASARTVPSELAISSSSEASRSSSVTAPASISASSKRSFDERREDAQLLADQRQVLVGRREPVLDGLDHRPNDASGVRRSWLAHATSSRRASNSCSRFAAISLNAELSSHELARPRLGGAGGEIAAGELRRSRAQLLERAQDPAREQQLRRRARRAPRRRPPRRSSSRRACRASPSPTTSTTAERQAHRSSASRELQPQGRSSTRAALIPTARRGRRRSRAQPVADAPHRLEQLRVRGIAPRASPGAAECERSPCRCRARTSSPRRGASAGRARRRGSGWTRGTRAARTPSP